MSDSHIAVPKRRYDMPLLLLCGLGFSVFAAAVGALVLVGFGLASLFGSGGNYTVNDQPVTRAQFYAAIWPLYLIAPLAFGCIAAIAYTLWREDPRSRPLMLGYWGLMVCVSLGLAIGEGTADAWAGVVPGALILLLAWAYLYRKANVVAYYRVLERARDPSAEAPPTQAAIREPGV